MEGWVTKPLGDIVVKTATIDPRKKPDESFFYVDVSSVSNKTLEITEATELMGKDAPSRARRAISSGDVIFATVRPTLRRIAIVPEYLDGEVCSTGYFVFQAKPELYNRYLYYFLQTEAFIARMEKLQAGASYPAVNDTQVRSELISYPEVIEQKRIVAILDEAFADIEQVRAKTEHNLNNARELYLSKKAKLFESLEELADLKYLPSVCDEIFAGGDAPKKGLFSKTKTEKYQIPIYANAVKDNGLYGFTDYSRANKPCITIAARGSGTGHIELRREPFLPIVRLIVLSPNEDLVYLDYFKHALQNLDILRSGSAIPQLTVPMIKEYSIPVPDLKIQQKTIEELEALEELIELMTERYKKKVMLLDELKKSILQKAFSGELTKTSDNKKRQGALA